MYVSALMAGAVITFDEPKYDFGTIQEDGGSVSHDFRFTNTGSEALVVVDVRTTCGCTVPQYPHEPIAPGQEGFIKVFTNLNEYSGNGSFEGWMRKIFINCALEKIRRSKVFPLTFPTEETEQETSFPNALEEISAQEMLDLIHRLPPGYQTIFNLFAIEGFSHKEIGAMLRITEGTSRSQYARARYTLQQMIKNLY